MLPWKRQYLEPQFFGAQINAEEVISGSWQRGNYQVIWAGGFEGH